MSIYLNPSFLEHALIFLLLVLGVQVNETMYTGDADHANTTRYMSKKVVRVEGCLVAMASRISVDRDARSAPW